MLSAKIVKPFIDLATFILPKPKYSIGQKHVDYSIYKDSGDWHIARTLADIKNTGLRIYLYCTKQTYTFDGNKVLGNIHIPTLIIHGNDDSIFPVKYGEYIHSKIKNSKIAIIKNTNHILVLNNFNEVSDLIEKFIENK
jgi:pimeloyl-ACP methyl ester carboxylesterase